MIRSMRTSRMAMSSALISAALVLSVLCPCRPAPSATTASAHDCCAPEAGIRSLAPNCCVAAARPAIAVVTASVSVPAPAGAYVLASMAILPVATVAASPSLAAPGSPPLILRI
jgi:hypothetical protein